MSLALLLEKGQTGRECKHIAEQSIQGSEKEKNKLRLDSWIQIRSTKRSELKRSSSVLLARRAPTFH